MLSVNSCCGCCSLRVGVIIISILDINFCFMAFSFYSVFISISFYEDSSQEEKLNKGKRPLFMIFLINLRPWIILLSFVIIKLITACFLLYDSKWNFCKREFILPWCIMLWISIFFLFMILFNLTYPSEQMKYNIISFCYFFYYLCLSTFFFIIVLSY